MRIKPHANTDQKADCLTMKPFTLDRLALKFHGLTVWLKLAAAVSYAGVWGWIWWMMT